jgi:flagellar hook protein FlgE
MIRSMFTAINALYVHQEFMDVVSDNLANVNTPGFKSSYMSFKNQFAQTLSTGAAPTTNLGGINPIQVGLGAVMGTVSPVFTPGPLESTGRQLDLAIAGEGFFIYNNGTTPQYSRDGNVQMDSEGYLVNGSTGARVQGWQSDLATQKLDTTAALTGIRIPVDSSVALQTTKVSVTGNLDVNTNTKDPKWIADPVTSGSVIDPASASLGSYATTFGIYDSLGNLQNITLTFQRLSSTGSLNDNSGLNLQTGTGSPVQYWTVHLTGVSSPSGSPAHIIADSVNAKGIDLMGAAYGLSSGSAANVDAYNFDTKYPALDISGGGHSPISGIKFNEFGQIDYGTQNLTLTIDGGAGAATRQVTIDLSSLTMLNSPSTVAANDQNGLPGGGLTGFNISDVDGKIYGVYSNGSQRVIGQFGLASFSNPSGLVREGNNVYSVGLNSGLARISPPGSGDKGSIQSGYREGSNVDMSREFANMILAQRGFEASTRLITTSDQMLQQLVNIGK